MISNIKQVIRNFINRGNERSVQAKKNIFFSIFIRGFSILINLILVPVTINYINPTQYGIWLTLSSIIAWFSFFDIGLGHGLRNRFSESKATRNFEIAKTYISTTYALLAIIFTSLWIIFFVSNFFLDWSTILNAPKGMAEELSILALIVFTYLCLSLILKTISTIVIADQRPALASLFDLLGNFLALIIIFILVKTTEGSLIKLGLVIGITQITVLTIATIFLFKKGYKEFSPSFKKIDFCSGKNILSLGIKFFIIQFSSIVIFQTTNIIITQVLGPEQVSIYNIAYKYFSALIMLFMIFTTPYWSAFTEAYVLRDFEWMKKAKHGLEQAWLLIIPIVLLMLIASEKIYLIWIGEVVKIPFLVSVSLAIYVLTYTRYNLYINLINGVGKVKLQLTMSVITCIIYIPIAIYTTRIWGLTGIIYTNVFLSLLLALSSQIQVFRIIGSNANGIWNK